jgi:hypothetical protein
MNNLKEIDKNTYKHFFINTDLVRIFRYIETNFLRCFILIIFLTF